MKKTWQELHDTSTPEDFHEAVMQDLVCEKFRLKQYKRNFRATVVCLLAALVASISICSWTISNIRAEYSVQIETLQNALEEKAAYKHKRVPGKIEDIIPLRPMFVDYSPDWVGEPEIIYTIGITDSATAEIFMASTPFPGNIF